VIHADAAPEKDDMMAHAVLSSSRVLRPFRQGRLVAVIQTGKELDALMRRVAGRDRAAFEILFAHFAPRIKAYLMRMGAPPQAAEDLAQEAMLMLWRKAALYDAARSSAATWVFTIARNLRIDMLRRERPRMDGEDPSLAPEPECAADDTLVIRDQENAVRLALRTLPAEQSQIVMLSFFSDKPHAEIAIELGIPLGTVKSRLRLAMSRLRTLLGETA
jgi:RNA polymerase sigma factor (sigma-70 family)